MAACWSETDFPTSWAKICFLSIIIFQAESRWDNKIEILTCSLRSTSQSLRVPKEPSSLDEGRWRFCNWLPWTRHHRRYKPNDGSVNIKTRNSIFFFAFWYIVIKIDTKLKASSRILTHQLIITQLRSHRAVHEPPSGRTDGSSTDVSTDRQIPEEQPARDETFVGFTRGLY